jgi:hypothetical protein
MSDPLTEVFAAFDQPFRELVDDLARQHPEAIFRVRNAPVGTATTFQGHMLYVECYWPGRGPDVPDNLILEVELCHLTTAPRINADVCWGHGSVEAEFATGWLRSDDWPEATSINLEQLSARMPELIEVFRRAVTRGMPDD